MGALATKVEVIRGPDGDLVKVNGITIPGASLMFHDALRVVISIPASEVKIVNESGPAVRRIALGEEA